MKTYTRKASLLALLSLLVVLLLSVLTACGEVANAQTTVTTHPKPDATEVVEKYDRLFNAGMKSGDFSAMSSVFAHDATLTQSNPKGVTTVIHGVDAIIHFFQGYQKKFAGFQWTIKSMRKLAPEVVLAYESAGSPPLKVPGRCLHVFVVENDKITSYDWATYYPGQP